MGVRLEVFIREGIIFLNHYIRDVSQCLVLAIEFVVSGRRLEVVRGGKCTHVHL